MAGPTPLDITRLQEEISKAATISKKNDERTKDAIDIYKNQLLIENKQQDNPRNELVLTKSISNDDEEEDDGTLYDIKNRMDYLINFVDTMKKQASIARKQGLDDEVRLLEQQKNDAEQQVDRLTQEERKVKKNYYQIRKQKKEDEKRMKIEQEAIQRQKEEDEYRHMQQLKQIEIDREQLKLEQQRLALDKIQKKRQAEIEKQLNAGLGIVKSAKAKQQAVDIADEKTEKLDSTIEDATKRNHRKFVRDIKKLASEVEIPISSSSSSSSVVPTFEDLVDDIANSNIDTTLNALSEKPASTSSKTKNKK